MARIPMSDTGKTPFKKIIGHNADIHKKWVALEEEFFSYQLLVLNCWSKYVGCQHGVKYNGPRKCDTIWQGIRDTNMEVYFEK